MYKVKSYGKEYQVDVHAKTYVDGGLAVTMDCLDDEFGCMMPFATLTVNLGRQNYGYAYLDTNNCPWAEDFVRENGLGEPVGKTCCSGFCVYPLYKFNVEKIGG